jgi:hypothetical protein
VNAPSDGSPRPVANLWGVYAGTASGRPATPGSCVPPDMGMADMGLTDAGIVDGSVSEMGIPDAGIVDASMSEMGIPDAGILDGSVSEMGIRDASGFDAASPDAGDSRGAGNPPHGLLGGCSCRVAPGAKTGNAGLGPTLFAALVAALAVSRRRRAAKSA